MRVGQVARAFGLPLFAERLPPRIEGALFWYPQGALIVYDPYRSRQRVRFTVAHEIGHWVLAQGTWPISCQSAAGSRTPEERMADRFAAALLMPADAVIAAWLRGEAFTALAARFDVSLEAMHWRLVELGLV